MSGGPHPEDCGCPDCGPSRLRRLWLGLRGYWRYRDLPAAYQIAEAVHAMLPRPRWEKR